MKYALIVLFSFIVGFLASTFWNRIFPDHFVVRVNDHRKCADPEYRVEMASYTVSAKGSQLGSWATQGDPLLKVWPSSRAPDEIRYRLRARYSDCPEVLSEERIVERGWVLYENIDEDGTVRHLVRVAR